MPLHKMQCCVREILFWMEKGVRGVKQDPQRKCLLKKLVNKNAMKL